MEIGTTYPDLNGDPIAAKRIHNISSDNFDDIIESALGELCAQIDWSPLIKDKEAPFVDSTTPLDGSTNVSIYSNVYISLKDDLPSAGIDLSNMKVILNNSMTDFDITGDIKITGDPYNYYLKWEPPVRVHDTYD